MKKLLIALAALVVLLVAVLVVGPFLVPTKFYTDRAVALVEASTGRRLTVSGPVRLSLLPQLQLVANEVALANAPGAANPEMVRLKQVDVQLKLLPLLHGSFEVQRLILIQPVIALEVDKNGHPNWNFGKTNPAAAPAPTRPAQGASTAFPSVSLGELRLEGGSISYLDQRDGQAVKLDDINARLSLPDLNSPLTGNGSAVWKQQKVALTLAIAKPGALMRGETSPLKFSLDAAPIKLAFDGETTGSVPAKLSGAVDLTVPSVRALAKWTGSPITASGNTFGSLAIKGKLDLAGAQYAFRDAAIAFDAMQATGDLTVDTAPARPYLKGQLTVDRLDLNPYLTPAQSVASAAPTPGANADQPIDVSWMNSADADFTLSTGALVYRKVKLARSALAIHLKDRKLAANLTQVALYAGTGKGTVMLDGTGPQPAIAANFAIAGVQMEPLLTALAGTDRLGGKGSLTLSVTAHGATRDALLHTLNGNGSFDIANGRLKGVDLMGVAQAALAAATRGATGGEETRFGSLTGSFTIVNGILHNDNLRLTSGLVPMQGAGTVNLPEATVDYRVTVRIAHAVPVPIVLTGPLDHLSYRPDLVGAVQDIAKSPGQVLQQLLPKTDLLKGLRLP